MSRGTSRGSQGVQGKLDRVLGNQDRHFSKVSHGVKVGILNQLAGPPQKLEHNRQNKNDIKIMLSNIFFAVWTISNNILF